MVKYLGDHLRVNAYHYDYTGAGGTLITPDSWNLADADALSTMPCVGISLGSFDPAGTANIMLYGAMRDDSWVALAKGTIIYASVTAGSISQTAVSGSGDQSQALGVACGTQTIIFRPSDAIVAVA